MNSVEDIEALSQARPSPGRVFGGRRELVNHGLRRLVDDFGGWLLPRRCRRCGAADSPMLCAACQHELPWNRVACIRCALPLPAAGVCAGCLQRPPPFERAFAALRLEATAQQAVHALKYRADFAQARLLAEAMAAALRREGRELPQLLIPVPLHRFRLMRRGHNQAAELARRLGARFAIAVELQAARRLRATEDQIGQGKAQRRRNMRGAFALRRRLDGLHIALVDDVMTTGATLEALARACRAAGAARIEVWAAARTP